MGLVDYSESDDSASETDAPVAAPPRPQHPPTSTTSKKPFQKVVDRSNPGKIVVSLPKLSSSSADAATADEEPPSKRARTSGGGRFSGFSSFLPAPKNANKPAAAASGVGGASQGQAAPFSFKTSAAPGFSREDSNGAAGGEREGEGASGTGGGMTGLPPPKEHAQPSIPDGQKPADEVKMVGKPTMFRPLSVARNNKAKKKKPVGAGAAAGGVALPASSASAKASTAMTAAEPAAAPSSKKTSLFTMHTETEAEDAPPRDANGRYEPLFPQAAPTHLSSDLNDQYADYAAAHASSPGSAPAPAPNTYGQVSESLDSIANDLNLSAAARRELFGRDGAAALGRGAKKVINFNMDTEYQHNEDLRAAGEQQVHNPVRAIQGGGKHSLKQLVQNVQDQKDAYEDSFAQGKNNRKEASSKYGW